MKPTKTIILFLFQILSISSIPSLIATNLIDDTCKATPSYDLCKSIIHADPSSARATKSSQLGAIVVRHVESKAKETLTHITQLLGQTQDPLKNGALQTCKGIYSTILQDIRPSLDAFDHDNPKSVVDNMKYVTTDVKGCESGFVGGKAPIALDNDYVKKSALVAAAIAKTLL